MFPRKQEKLFPFTEHNELFHLLEVLNKRLPEIRQRKSPISIKMPDTPYRGNLVIEYTGGHVILSLESWGRTSIKFMSVVPGVDNDLFSYNYKCFQYFTMVRGCELFINDDVDEKKNYKFENDLYKYPEEFRFALDLEYKDEETKQLIELVARFKRTVYSEFDSIVMKIREIDNYSISLVDIIHAMNKSPFFWKNFE